MLTPSDLAHFEVEGYLIIDHALPAGLLDELRAATGRVTERTRRGEWPHKRRAGDDDIWGVSHLLHPDLGEPVFARYLASPEVLDVVGDLLDIEPNERPARLQLELVNLLVNSERQDHNIGWHRDLVRADLLPDAELAALNQLQHGVQWNTALYDEACLLIVPGSHRRSKSPEEGARRFTAAWGRSMGHSCARICTRVCAGWTRRAPSGRGRRAD